MIETEWDVKCIRQDNVLAFLGVCRWPTEILLYNSLPWHVDGNKYTSQARVHDMCRYVQRRLDIARRKALECSTFAVCVCENVAR